MYLCLNKLASKAWKKNCPNLYATVQSWKKVKVIIFPFILGCFSFVSNAASFFIHSLNRFDLKKGNHLALLFFFIWVPDMQILDMNIMSKVLTYYLIGWRRVFSCLFKTVFSWYKTWFLSIENYIFRKYILQIIVISLSFY